MMSSKRWIFSLLLMSSLAQAAPATEARARKLLDQLAAREFAAVRANMTEQVAAALPSNDMLADIWQKVAGPLGKLVRVESVRTASQAGIDVVVLECRFEKGTLTAQLALDGRGRLAGLFFPSPTAWTAPPYAAPDRTDERDVSVGPLALPGKLTLPRGAGPFPAVVLVHGSGPSDENEAIGPIEVFHDLALGLAARGVAVLRYQKRTFARKEACKAAPRFTVREETTDDARAAVALLAATAGIDARRIFVAGHSLGGMLAPRIAVEEPRVAGLVIMAGPTRPLEEVVVEQMQARGTPEQQAAAHAALARIRDPKLAPTDRIDFVGSMIPASYFLDLRGYSPAATAARLDVPILVLQGDRDIQVTKTDFDGWARALTARPRARLQRYATLTHLFVEGRGSLADYDKPANVAPAVIEDIAAFVKGAHK